MRVIQGNFSNSQSFLATMLAKQYLMERFDIEDFDAAEKSQGAPGLDIEITTRQGERIVGEIKTTRPYGRSDFGAQQRTTIRKDFAKLNKAEVDHRFFFVTDPRAYRYVVEKYSDEIPGVEVVLLADTKRATD